jgi:hypothetical protein
MTSSIEVIDRKPSLIRNASGSSSFDLDNQSSQSSEKLIEDLAVDQN